MDLAVRLEVLERLSRLRGEGALTGEEFAAAKSNLLSQSMEIGEAAERRGDQPSIGDKRSNYSKWAVTAALVTAAVGGAYLTLSQSRDENEIAVQGSAKSPEIESQATESSGADRALNEAAEAVEAAGAAMEEAVADVDGPTTTESPEVDAQPPSQEVSYEPRDAKPARDLQSYVTSDDYPSSSIQRGEQGSVGFTLTIGTSGRATDCSITASSGFRALDTATCNIMTRRARFTPAYDATGTPVMGSVSSTIGWRLAE